MAIADAVHQCIVSELKAPADDRFQVITEHDADSLIYDPTYLNVKRTDDVIFIQNHVEDVLINLVEVPKENWSFGDGIAQYAPEEKV